MVQDPLIMGLQGTANKRKIGPSEYESPQPTKMSRSEEWGDQYLPSGNTRSYQCYPSGSFYSSPTSGSADDYRSCYQVQQTIQCDENGKSYLDLGSWNSNASGKCCEGRTTWCSRGPSCYRQKRLAVLNISMCKLGRYRQFSDPSLHRSVLICNTLRLIEREMEQEGYFSNINNVPASALEPPHPSFPEVPVPYEPPRVATPFPPPVTEESSMSDERSINWGSVLSLSSQSDLDPLNNNDCLDNDPDLDEFLPSWKLTPDDLFHSVSPRASDSAELDSIMHVLVGT